MALVSSPYGLQPVSDQSGPAVRPLRIPFGIASGYGLNIFKGAPVNFNVTTNQLQLVTAANQAIFGVFQGIEYTPLGGRPQVSPFWPAGTTYDPNYDTFVYVYPGWLESLRWRIQSTGSIPQLGTLAAQYNLTNFTLGSTSIGLSQCGVLPTPLATGVTGQVTLVEFDTGINSSPGDAFTDGIFSINLSQIGNGAQPSIG